MLWETQNLKLLSSTSRVATVPCALEVTYVGLEIWLPEVLITRGVTSVVPSSWRLCQASEDSEYISDVKPVWISIVVLPLREREGGSEI